MNRGNSRKWGHMCMGDFRVRGPFQDQRLHQRTRDDFIVKKVSDIPVPGRDVTYQTPWAEIVKLFKARKSLVSDITAGDGNVADVATK